MSRFILLHQVKTLQTFEEPKKGEPILINLANVTNFQPLFYGDVGTFLVMGTREYYIFEPFTQIVEQIKQRVRHW